jgi:hypothetical protein
MPAAEPAILKLPVSRAANGARSNKAAASSRASAGAGLFKAHRSLKAFSLALRMGFRR